MNYVVKYKFENNKYDAIVGYKTIMSDNYRFTKIKKESMIKNDSGYYTYEVIFSVTNDGNGGYNNLYCIDESKKLPLDLYAITVKDLDDLSDSDLSTYSDNAKNYSINGVCTSTYTKNFKVNKEDSNEYVIYENFMTSLIINRIVIKLDSYGPIGESGTIVPKSVTINEINIKDCTFTNIDNVGKIYMSNDISIDNTLLDGDLDIKVTFNEEEYSNSVLYAIQSYPTKSSDGQTSYLYNLAENKTGDDTFYVIRELTQPSFICDNKKYSNYFIGISTVFKGSSDFASANSIITSDKYSYNCGSLYKYKVIINEPDYFQFDHYMMTFDNEKNYFIKVKDDDIVYSKYNLLSEDLEYHGIDNCVKLEEID